jgi:F0F1-type ATP synthase assembly protein I
MIVSGLALSLPAMLFGPPAIGYWLDTVLGTSPWFMLGFLAIGFLGTGIDVYVILKRTKVIA